MRPITDPGDSGLEAGLLVLVQAYVAHLNGCQECAEGYGDEARATGEDDQRLRLLPFWSEAPFHTYTARERAALAWTEGVVRGREGTWEELRQQTRTELSEHALAELTLAVVSTQGWSRVAAALGVVPPHAPSPRSPARATGECSLCGTG